MGMYLPAPGWTAHNDSILVLSASHPPSKRPAASVTDVLKAVREAGEGCGEDDAAAMAARCMLHSAVLELRHPSTGVPTRIEADIPADMQAVLTVLRECQKPT
mmetsp:Transcript_30138/g.90300  ORF Transcript_30138/g.90300 Transcript_30138/m.90300 type:complete len:103 (+) Transcript_30138:1327-1635(+)